MMKDIQPQIPHLLPGRPSSGVPRKEQIRKSAEKRRKGNKMLSVEINEELHSRIKNAAICRKISIKRLVIDAVTEKVL